MSLFYFIAEKGCPGYFHSLQGFGLERVQLEGAEARTKLFPIWRFQSANKESRGLILSNTFNLNYFLSWNVTRVSELLRKRLIPIFFNSREAW